MIFHFRVIILFRILTLQVKFCFCISKFLLILWIWFFLNLFVSALLKPTELQLSQCHWATFSPPAHFVVPPTSYRTADKTPLDHLKVRAGNSANAIFHDVWSLAPLNTFEFILLKRHDIENIKSVFLWHFWSDAIRAWLSFYMSDFPF